MLKLIHVNNFASFPSAELAVKLCEDDELLKSIAECAERDTIIGICAEGRRLTAALVKNCQSNGNLSTILFEKILNIARIFLAVSFMSIDYC